jgi:3-deoxy-D-manno-octulosonic-acid transferase
MVLYFFGIRIYHLFIQIFSLFNLKAKLFINGRKNWEENYLEVFKSINKPVLWMHCASVGEFEQGRVLLEKLNDLKQNYFVLLTFFSPSGFELRKHYAFADKVLYLPLDIGKNAEKFIAIAKPSIAIFVKYEIWLGYFKALKTKQIPTYLICAKFRTDQVYFKWYGKIYKSALQNLNQIFIQTEEDVNILNKNGISNYTISGDLRYERVLEIKNTSFEDKNILHFVKKDSLTIIAGSTWGRDEVVLLKCLHQINEKNLTAQLIIAPHEIGAKQLKQLKFLLELLKIKFQSLSTYDVNLTDTQVLIIDSIGSLSKVYRYADIAYVGGGFGSGIHNTLEPAVYGIPVFFGPKNEKFAEAQWLKENQCGFQIRNNQELFSQIQKLQLDKTTLNSISEKLNQLFVKNKNSSEIIKSGIFKNGNRTKIFKISNLPL